MGKKIMLKYTFFYVALSLYKIYVASDSSWISITPRIVIFRNIVIKKKVTETPTFRKKKRKTFKNG